MTDLTLYPSSPLHFGRALYKKRSSSLLNKRLLAQLSSAPFLEERLFNKGGESRLSRQEERRALEKLEEPSLSFEIEGEELFLSPKGLINILLKEGPLCSLLLKQLSQKEYAWGAVCLLNRHLGELLSLIRRDLSRDSSTLLSSLLSLFLPSGGAKRRRQESRGNLYVLPT